MQKVLPAIIHRDSYTKLVEAELLAWLREAIFMPLLIELHQAGVQTERKFQDVKFDEEGTSYRVFRSNALYGAVIEALRIGRIHYAAGVFSGKFNAAISKELREMGASFSRSDRNFWLAEQNLPDEVKGQVNQSWAAAKALHEQIDRTLVEMQGNIAAAPIALDFAKAGEAIINDLGRQFISTVQQTAVKADISVPAQFIGAQRQMLTDELTENLTLGIKNFAAERIPELRRRVEENVVEGMRTDRLAKIIEAEFGIGQRKAEFLADQETGLFVSKYRETRYRSIGITDYIWQTSHDNRVRHSHAILDGKRFSFASPPVVTGPGQPIRRCNPGEDYRCRCISRGIVNLQVEAA